MPTPVITSVTPKTGTPPFNISISGSSIFERPNYTVRCLLGDNGDVPTTTVTEYKGSAPFKGTGIIGSSLLCRPATNNWAITGRFQSVPQQTWQNVGQHEGIYLWPRATRPVPPDYGYYDLYTTQYFVSMWIKPSRVDTYSGIFQFSRGWAASLSEVDSPYNNNYANSLGLYMLNGGRIGFFQKTVHENFSGQYNYILLKNVYTTEPSLTANTWTHVLVQWTPTTPNTLPEIWIDGVNTATTTLSNAPIPTRMVCHYSVGNGVSILGRGHTCNNETPPIIPGSWRSNDYTPIPGASEWVVGVFDGEICNVYSAQSYLSTSDVRKYATLPTIEHRKLIT